MDIRSANLLGIGQMQADLAKDVRLDQKSAQMAKQPLNVSSRDVKDPEHAKKNAEIKQLSEDFESLFLGMVLKSMRDSVQKSGLIDGGNAENIYRSLLDDEYAKQMASQHHTGLADQIADFLIGQNQVRGHKAYDGQGLPDDAKQATISSKTRLPTPADTKSSPLQVPSRDVMKS
jgi:Rod binding domain-containing protein